MSKPDDDREFCEHCDAELDEGTFGVFTTTANTHVCEDCWDELDPPEENNHG